MSTSAYIDMGCVEVNKLEPWSLIFIGIMMQMVINAFILISKDQNEWVRIESTNDHAKSNQSSRCCKSLFKCMINSFRMVLILWQVISIIMVLISDIMHAIDAMKQVNTKWDKYQCFVSILYSSSNAKTLYSYIATLAGMMQHTQEANPSEFVRHRFAASKSKLYFIYFAAVLVKLISSVRNLISDKVYH